MVLNRTVFSSLFSAIRLIGLTQLSGHLRLGKKFILLGVWDQAGNDCRADKRNNWGFSPFQARKSFLSSRMKVFVLSLMPYIKWIWKKSALIRYCPLNGSEWMNVPFFLALKVTQSRVWKRKGKGNANCWHPWEPDLLLAATFWQLEKGVKYTYLRITVAVIVARIFNVLMHRSLTVKEYVSCQ